MAHECTDQSYVAISSSIPPNWWDLHHPSPWNQPKRNISMSSFEGDHVSITNSCFSADASNHSGLTVDSSPQVVDHHQPSSSNEFIDGHVSDIQLWTHILFSGSDQFRSNQEIGEDFVGTLSSTSTNTTAGMFDPACDFLKKMDGDWEFTSSSSSNTNFVKQVNGFNSESSIESKRLTNLVSNWSIAPPDSEVNRGFDPITTCNEAPLSPSLKQSSTSYNPEGKTNSGFLSPIYHGQYHFKMENGIEEIEPLPKRSFSYGDLRYGVNYCSPMVGDYGKYHCATPDATCSSARNFADFVASNGQLTKPLVDPHQVTKSASVMSSNLSDCRKQGLQSSSPPAGRRGAPNEGKKKRSEENMETVAKKPKQESSPSLKMQAPKAKLADKITLLQQIVSPFGKTDTASVLFEAIQYIKILQEQVQLLSNPYMKNLHKDPWGGVDIKDKGDAIPDLRCRGLCLVPISYTPQVCRENTGSDYWTPTYRGCLYR